MTACPICIALLGEALRHALIVSSPVGDRLVGPREAAVWARLQAVSIIEVAESAARLRICPGD